MPVYIYKCEKSHYTERLRSFDLRNDPLSCPECDQPMCKVPAYPPKKHDPDENGGKSKIKIKYRHGRSDRVFHFRDAASNDCGKYTHVDCTNSEKEYDKDAAECEHCQSKNVTIDIPIPSIDRFGERFPYYDRGLGMWLTSRNHRKEMCKKLGVVPIDGNIDFSREVHKIEEKQKADKKIVDDLKDKMDNHPGYAEYRRMKDRGYKPEFKHRKRS